jgi:membrane carboxypeptidase/penicillin-binding protein
MDHTPLHTRSRKISWHQKHPEHLLDTCRRQRTSPFKIAFFCAVLAAGGLAIFLLVYGSAVVLSARRNTPALMARALAPERIKLRVAQVSRRRLDALIKVEDPAFFSHRGVDFATPGAGLTTITQALVKIFYFRHFRPGFAKFKQTLIARYAMDPLVSKQDQLTLLLNYAYMGECRGAPVRGFPAAARCYYGKDFSVLTDDEYLLLVGLLVAPNIFNPVTNPRASQERVARIKKLLSGDYKPEGHMDIYYGPLAPASYFGELYRG